MNNLNSTKHHDPDLGTNNTINNSPWNSIPNQLPQMQRQFIQEPKHPIHNLSDFRWFLIPGSIFAIATLSVIFFIVILPIIREGSLLISRLAGHVAYLFNSASLSPYNTRGFSSFVQLVIIAMAIGITIKWLKRR